MSSIYIDFSRDDNVKRSINSAKRAINSRINDYDGIIKKVNGVESNTGNLSTANSYIKKKRNKLQNKYDKLEDFRKKIDSFNDFAQETDKAVAKRIKKETKDFYKRENIPHGFFYTVGCICSDIGKWIKGTAEKIWDTICTVAKKTWEAIKQWYEENKYWFDILIDVVMVVAAAAALICSGGVAAAIFATWALAKATFDLVFDCYAYKAYKDGDMELYEELSNSGLKDIMCQSPLGKVLYYGMEVASVVYGITKVFKSGAQLFKDYKLLYKNDVSMIAKISDATKKQIIISDIKDIVFKITGLDNMDPATGKWEGIKSVIDISKWSLELVKNAMTANTFGDFVIESIDLSSKIKKGFEGVREIVNVFAGEKISTSIPAINPSIASPLVI